MAVIEAISTQYLEADAATVTFSSIPATYEHLELHVSIRSDQSAVYHAMLLQAGTGGGAADSGSNYWAHYMWANGTNVAAGAAQGTGFYVALAAGASTAATYYGPTGATILDYANTNKNTTFYGNLHTGALGTSTEYLEVSSAVWDNTGAVDLLKILPYSAGNLVRGSEFTLYGLNSA